MNRLMTIPILLLILSSCNKIETGQTLNKEDIKRIKNLNLLGQDETIIKFYSEFKNSVAGNFFTDKRLAKYWLDEKDSTKNIKSSAYYSEIKSIDTIFYAGLTYCPYMLVTKIDDSQFKVCVDGKREQIKAFFEEAINKWRQVGKTK